MSENKKRFNLIDLLIIIVVIGAIFVAVKYFNGSAGNGNSEGDIITYKLNIQSEQQYLIDEIQIGDKVFDSVKNFEIGEVTDIVTTEAVDSVYDAEQNKYKTITLPERYDLLITVKSKGIEKEDGIFVNGIKLQIGKSMFIRGANFATQAIIWEVGGTK